MLIQIDNDQAVAVIASATYAPGMLLIPEELSFPPDDDRHLEMLVEYLCAPVEDRTP